MKVKMITLEEYLKKSPSLRSSPFPKGDFVVKMDIEGMEFEVLESWSEEIWEMIGSLIVEVHFLREGDMDRFLEMKAKLSQIFGTVVYEESAYSEKVGLLYARRIIE